MVRLKFSISIENFNLRLVAWKFQSRSEILNFFNLWALWVLGVSEPPPCSQSCLPSMWEKSVVHTDLGWPSNAPAPRTTKKGKLVTSCAHISPPPPTYTLFLFFWSDTLFGGPPFSTNPPQDNFSLQNVNWRPPKYKLSRGDFCVFLYKNCRLTDN